jgi:8-oxo-dGTP pyrophosphatase MutT (NUDIX family)
LREIYEEIWLQLDIVPWFKESVFYIDHTTPAEKTVVFFLCDAGSWKVILSDELQDALWLNYEQALQQLTHDDSKILLTKAYDFLNS